MFGIPVSSSSGFWAAAMARCALCRGAGSEMLNAMAFDCDPGASDAFVHSNLLMQTKCVRIRSYLAI